MGESLESALAAFAVTRSAIIAAKVAELGKMASPNAALTGARKKIDFQRSWLAVVAEPAARGRCLEQLTEKLPKVDEDGNLKTWGETSYALEARLRALLSLAPDPRVATTLLAKLELNEPVIGASGVTDLIWELIPRHADDETRSALEKAGFSTEKLDLPARVTLTEAEAGRWSLSAPRESHDLRALWADVLAAPDEDAPRLVLADALLELGDPRGELIAIQLREASGVASSEASARAAELVSLHGKEWLGAIRPIVYRAEYTRGVVTRIELAGSWSSSKWETLAGDPAWHLVEEVEAGYANANVFAELLQTPALRANLRSITVDSKPVWQAIVASPLPRLERLRCWHWKRGDVSERLREDVLPYVSRTSSVVALGLPLGSLPDLDPSTRERLVELETNGSVVQLAKLWSDWPKLRKLSTLWGERVELVRDGTRELARYRPTTFFKGDGKELLALPKTIKRLEIYGNAAFVKRATPVLGKRFELVPCPLPSGLLSNTKA